MDPAALASRLEAIDGRLAGSDAERRAAASCARELRAAGRRVRTQTLWFRPQRAVPRAVTALAGVAGSVVAVSHPVVGTALAGGALLACVLDAAGIRVLAPLLPRRATQNVLAPPPAARGERVVLLVVASLDAPRRALSRRLERPDGMRPAPGPLGWLGLALAGVLVCAGLRIDGSGGTVLGVIQLIPTVGLLALAGLFTDVAMGPPLAPSPAGGAAVAVALAQALDARPPAALAPEVLLAGAGEAGAAGMAALVAERRRRLTPEDVVVLELRAGDGPVRCVVREGELGGSRLHPRLAELALALPGVEPAQRRGRGAARVARGAGWPAIALEGPPRALAPAALRLVAAIDREVAERRTGAAPG